MKQRAQAWVAENRLLTLSLGVSAAGVIAAVVIALVLGSWLTGTGPGEETGSTTLRNLGIGLAALVALPLAIWRAQVADQQAEAAREQAEAAERQAETAQEDLRNKRYQESAEMLGSRVLPVRLAGIYSLRSLAEEHPAEYHKRVMRSLCAFVRHPATDQPIARSDAVREDVEIAVREIAACHDAQIETDFACGLDLTGADLRRASLGSVNLSSAAMPKPLREMVVRDLSQADAAQLSAENLVQAVVASLSRLPLFELVEKAWVSLWLADLSGADLRRARLRNAILIGSNLSGAELHDADLSGALLSGQGTTKGLTQEQLDSALCDLKNPPNLDGLVDPGTGDPLKPPHRGLDGKPHPKSDIPND